MFGHLTGRPTRTSNIKLPLRGACCLPVASDVKSRMKLLRNLIVAFAAVAGAELISAAVGRPLLFPSPAWFVMSAAVGFMGFMGFRRLPPEVFSGGTLQINQLRRVASAHTYQRVAWSTFAFACAILFLCIFTSPWSFSIAFPIIWLSWLTAAHAVLKEEVQRDATT